MIQRMEFKKRFAIDSRLHQFPDIYAIQSDFDKRVAYGIEKNKFTIFSPTEVVCCDFDEVPELANQMVPGAKWEILEIYQLILELRYKYKRAI